MEPLQPATVSVNTARRPGLLARLVVAGSLGFATLAALPGCIPDMFLTEQAQATGIPCRIATRWNHDVQFPSDTVSGKPLPTIGGRVSLFGTDLVTPVIAEGSMMVYMYDDMPDAKNREEPIEIWVFRDDDVHRLRKKDAVGWGFTIPLPWQTYRPDLTHVKMKVRFDRVGGKEPIWSEAIPVTFEKEPERPRFTITKRQISLTMNSDPQALASGLPGMQQPTGMAGMPQLNGGANGAPRLGTEVSSGGGSQPTSISLSPPPTPGSNVPFVLPPPGAVK